ncbi:MAG: hypothetical protein LUC94_14920 [Clostridiales bacterium]|nr:hypothetical protein [Clostridiales bacterium]
MITGRDMVTDGRQRMTETELLYFETWAAMSASGRTLTMLGHKLEVSTAAVTKRMRAIVQRGYLTERYEMTSLGAEFYMWCRLWEKGIHVWYQTMGISETDARNVTRDLLARAPVPVLDMMMNQGIICLLRGNRRISSSERDGCLEFRNVEFANMLPEGRYSVYVTFRKLDGNEPSMAESAFGQTRMMVIEAGRSELRLQRQMILHHSMTEDYDVRGQMKSLEYEVGTRTRKPKIQDDIVRIPMKDMIWKIREGNDSSLVGELEVSFACTAGEQHMPRASALMCVKIQRTNAAFF